MEALFRNVNSQQMIATMRKQKMFLWFLRLIGRAPIRGEKQKIGAHFEERAADFLTAQGLIVVEKNLRPKNRRRQSKGEIDLLAFERDVPVFVEVRYRGKGAWVSAGQSINAHKSATVIQTARTIMKERGMVSARFDAVLFDGPAPPQWVRGGIRLD